MIDRVYCGALFSYDFLEHSYKGTEWKDHKYIKKENGRYYYPNESGASNSHYSGMSLDRLQEEYTHIKTAQEEYYNKANEMDEIAKTSEDPERYRQLANEYRSKLEELGRESIIVSNEIEKKSARKQLVEDFKFSPIDTAYNLGQRNREKLHTGNPIVRVKKRKK